MTGIREIILGLETLGRLSCREFLLAENWDKERLMRDWFYALKFLLSRIYFQGRKDELSKRYWDTMRGCLDSCFSEDPNTKLRALLENGDIPRHPIQKHTPVSENRLWARFDKSMGKEQDRRMVLDVLRYISALEDHNVVNQSLAAIAGQGAERHRQELENIYGVGAKTSAFYLRELVCLFNCRIGPADFIAMQAIDTWVRKLAGKLQAGLVNAPGEEIGRWFVDNAPSGCDLALVNAGGWYLERRGADVLLMLLRRGVMSSVTLERLLQGELDG